MSWVRSVYVIKDNHAASIKGKKIIIAAGSNALFGIDSKLLEDITGLKVTNLACHASFNLDFLYYKIKEHIGEGDVVVLPLEFAHYYQEMTDLFIDNMIEWGQNEYLAQLSPNDLISFIRKVSPSRIAEGILQEEKSKYPTDQEIVKQLNLLLQVDGQKWRGYRFKSLNNYGDMLVGEKPTKTLLEKKTKGIDYLNVNKPIIDSFFNEYRKILSLTKKYNSVLILTWPVTIRNKYFDLTKIRYQKNIKKFKKLLADKNISIECNPALFNLDINCFFDTKYHLNKIGARIRTENLGTCLNAILNNGSCDITFKEAASVVAKKELSYLPSNNRK